jgi:energy-coupling factor transport system permease protein
MGLFGRFHGGIMMKSRFYTFHPAVNFSYYIGSIALIMLFKHPLFLVIGLLILLINHYFTDRFKSLFRWFYLLLVTGSMIFIITPLFNERGRHLLFEVVEHRVTLEAVLYGGMSALSIMGIMVLFVSYNEVLTPNKLLFLFSKFLPQFAVLLMLTLRFIPLMRRRLSEISSVQMTKGISLSHGAWKERMRKGMQYIQVLITFSLEEAIQTADSMKARGYGQYKRTAYEHFRMKSSDIVALFYFFILFSVCLYGQLNGLGVLNVYPFLETTSLLAIEIPYLILYVLFFSFPLYVEIGGVIRWRFLN